MSILVGNAVVGQSGGPTSAINATLAGVIEGALSPMGREAIKTLYGMRNGIDGLLSENLVNLTEIFTEDESRIETLKLTPATALGSCRKKLTAPESSPETYEKLFEIFKKYDIRYFFYIGGNDSMDTVMKLSRYAKEHSYELRVIGVPKIRLSTFCASPPLLDESLFIMIIPKMDISKRIKTKNTQTIATIKLFLFLF